MAFFDAIFVALTMKYPYKQQYAEIEKQHLLWTDHGIY